MCRGVLVRKGLEVKKKLSPTSCSDSGARDRIVVSRLTRMTIFLGAAKGKPAQLLPDGMRLVLFGVVGVCLWLRHSHLVVPQILALIVLCLFKVTPLTQLPTTFPRLLANARQHSVVGEWFALGRIAYPRPNAKIHAD